MKTLDKQEELEELLSKIEERQPMCYNCFKKGNFNREEVHIISEERCIINMNEAVKARWGDGEEETKGL